MSSALSDDPPTFRAQVEAWFESHAPKKGSAGDFSAIHIISGRSIDEYTIAEHAALSRSREWQKALHGAGLAGRSWTPEYGGQGGPAWQDATIAEVQGRYGVSTKVLAIALEMLPPVLMAHGTHEQRVRHLPAVLQGDEVWCQLLSEPDAGSDLGSAKTVAVGVDGGWSVTGQKVWTSGAGIADLALLIARTEPDVAGMAGLSCLILDMKAPGVEVRPLRQISGAFHFNEVFLTDVLVPTEALIGGLGGGRAVLRTMLASERSAIGGGTSARSASQLMDLAGTLGRQRDPLVRQLVAAAYIREKVLDLTGQRVASGGSLLGGGSITKLMYSEHARLSAEAGLTLLGASGAAATALTQPWLDRFLFAPGLRIGGGTDEIQRNTIAERGLGLPR